METEMDTLKTIGAIAGPIVALISITMNFYQFPKNIHLQQQNLELQQLNRNTPSPVLRRDEIRACLNAILTKFASADIKIRNPHSEYWEYAFPSFEELE
jgi:hypothetical protein